jgi:hypothetical protein
VTWTPPRGSAGDTTGWHVDEWKVVTRGLWIRQYQPRNPVNTSVVDLGDGGLMAISPGTDVPPEAFDALDRLGVVKALVSPGAFHHLGMPHWKARYPNAGLYGPTSAIAHIAKQHPGLEAVKPLDALRPLLSAEFDLGELDGCTHPDLFLAMTRDGETTWFSNEVLTNSADYPQNFLFRWAFKLTGNHPGIQANTLTALLIGAKKPLVRAYYERKLASVPPTRLVPCHGDVAVDPALATKIGEAFARRY